MPRYDYACADCELGFEVSRSFKDADEPVACPVCGEPAKRQMTVPMATYTRGAAAEKLRAGPASAPGGAGGPSSGGWYHHGHSHGAGSAGHKH